MRQRMLTVLPCLLMILLGNAFHWRYFVEITTAIARRDLSLCVSVIWPFLVVEVYRFNLLFSLYLYLRFDRCIESSLSIIKWSEKDLSVVTFFRSFENQWYRLEVSTRFRIDDEKESLDHARFIASCQRCDWICRVTRCLVLLLDEHQETVLLCKMSRRLLLLANLSVRWGRE